MRPFDSVSSSFAYKNYYGIIFVGLAVVGCASFLFLTKTFTIGNGFIPVTSLVFLVFLLSECWFMG